MKSLDTLGNEALDLSEALRAKMNEIINAAENIEGGGDIVDLINQHASKFVSIDELVEDVYAAIEDLS